MNSNFKTVAETLSTESLETWLANHKMCIEMGVNVGQIDRDKAQAFRLELATRPCTNHVEVPGQNCPACNF